MARKKGYADGGDVNRADSRDEVANLEASARADKVGDEPQDMGKPGYSPMLKSEGRSMSAREERDVPARGAPSLRSMTASEERAVSTGVKAKPAPVRRKAPAVNMSDALAKIEAHEARKRARDAAESGSPGPGYAKGGQVRGVGAAQRGFRPAKYY